MRGTALFAPHATHCNEGCRRRPVCARLTTPPPLGSPGNVPVPRPSSFGCPVVASRRRYIPRAERRAGTAAYLYASQATARLIRRPFARLVTTDAAAPVDLRERVLLCAYASLFLPPPPPPRPSLVHPSSPRPVFPSTSLGPFHGLYLPAPSSPPSAFPPLAPVQCRRPCARPFRRCGGR